LSSIQHSPRTRGFIDAYLALCRRHGIHLAIEDGAFTVQPLVKLEQLEPANQARDDVRGLPIFAKLGIALGDDGLPKRMRNLADVAGNLERELLQTGAEEIVKLRRGLAQAIAEVDRQFAESQDLEGTGMQLETPEMDALRAMLPAGAARVT
jgi:hypothetical protein